MNKNAAENEDENDQDAPTAMHSTDLIWGVGFGIVVHCLLLLGPLTKQFGWRGAGAERGQQ